MNKQALSVQTSAHLPPLWGHLNTKSHHVPHWPCIAAPAVFPNKPLAEKGNCPALKNDLDSHRLF